MLGFVIQVRIYSDGSENIVDILSIWKLQDIQNCELQDIQNRNLDKDLST
jgi:hypothetical protein